MASDLQPDLSQQTYDFLWPLSPDVNAYLGIPCFLVLKLSKLPFCDKNFSIVPVSSFQSKSFTQEKRYITGLLLKLFSMAHVKTAVLALSVLLGLTCCGPSTVWYSPTKSVIQTQEDLQACKYEANTRVHLPFSNDSLFKGMARVRRRVDIKECMLSKGYQLTDTKYLESQGLEFFSKSPYQKPGAHGKLSKNKGRVKVGSAFVCFSTYSCYSELTQICDTCYTDNILNNCNLSGGHYKSLAKSSGGQLYNLASNPRCNVGTFQDKRCHLRCLIGRKRHFICHYWVALESSCY